MSRSIRSEQGPASPGRPLRRAWLLLGLWSGAALAQPVLSPGSAWQGGWPAQSQFHSQSPSAPQHPADAASAAKPASAPASATSALTTDATASAPNSDAAPADPAIELTLEELLRQPSRSHKVEVSTASRYAEHADRSPSVTYVLTRLDLQRHGVRTLADALQLMPQIYPGRRGAYTVAGARGVGRPADFNARMLLVVDGVRLNENIYDSALIDQNFLLDIGVVDRIEYTPGPGSAMYGNNAFIGVIQVFTRRGGQLDGLSTTVQADRQGSQRAGAQLGWRGDSGAEWLLSATRGQSRRIPLDPGIQANLNPDLKLGELLSRRWDWDTRLQLSGQWSGWSWMWAQSQAQRGFPNLRWNDARTDILYVQDREGDLSRLFTLAYDGSLDADWDLHLGYQRSHYIYRYQSPAVENTPSYYSRGDGRWQVGDLRLENHSWAGHHWVAGIEQQYDRLREQVAGNDLGVLVGPLRESAHRYAIYLQDSWDYSPSHTLVAGWRRDLLPGVYAATNPRLAWNYRQGERDIWRWQYGTAFRAPNLSERSGNQLMGVDPPQPERVRSHQWSWEREWAPGWRTQLTHFRSRVIGLIEPDDSGFVTMNRQNLRSHGWEWLVDDRRSAVWRWQFSGTWQKSRTDSSEPLTNSPRLLVKFRGTYHPAGQSEWSVDAMQIGARQGYGMAAPSTFKVNLAWRWQPAPRQSLTIAVDNLFDRRIIDPSDGTNGVLTNYGRNLRFSWTRSWP